MPEADNKVAPGQVPDPLAVYLAAAGERWNAAGNGTWEDHATALELLSSALRSVADVPRLFAALAVPLRLHHPVPAHDPQHPKLLCCDRCSQPWPCYEYEQITKALTREDG